MELKSQRFYSNNHITPPPHVKKKQKTNPNTPVWIGIYIEECFCWKTEERNENEKEQDETTTTTINFTFSKSAMMCLVFNFFFMSFFFFLPDCVPNVANSNEST